MLVSTLLYAYDVLLTASTVLTKHSVSSVPSNSTAIIEDNVLTHVHKDIGQALKLIPA
jgi:hypothetical protein